MSLKLESFETDRPVPALEFHSYRAEYSDPDKTIQQFMRGICLRITNRLKIPAYTNDEFIYTLEEITDLDFMKELTLSKVGKEVLEVRKNAGIYASVILNEIKQNLKMVPLPEEIKGKTYPKYTVGQDISTVWFSEKNRRVSSVDRKMRLNRKFELRIELTESQTACMYLNLSHDS